MYWEAKSEGPDGMLAVASVVLNRVAHPEFPDTVCGVVKQGGESPPCQFSWWCDGRSDLPVEARPWATATRIAERALRDPPSDLTRGALFFHNISVETPWTCAPAHGPDRPAHLLPLATGYKPASGRPTLGGKPEVAMARSLLLVILALAVALPAAGTAQQSLSPLARSIETDLDRLESPPVKSDDRLESDRIQPAERGRAARLFAPSELRSAQDIARSSDLGAAQQDLRTLKTRKPDADSIPLLERQLDRVEPRHPSLPAVARSRRALRPLDARPSPTCARHCGRGRSRLTRPSSSTAPSTAMASSTNQLPTGISRRAKSLAPITPPMMPTMTLTTRP